MITKGRYCHGKTFEELGDKLASRTMFDRCIEVVKTIPSQSPSRATQMGLLVKERLAARVG
jgi:hypothetical protein